MKFRILWRWIKLFGITDSIRLLFFYKFKFNKDSLFRLNKKGYGDIYLRQNSSDFGLLGDFLWADLSGKDNMYDFSKIDMRIKNVHTIVDCGANIGMFSIKMAETYRDATFYCVEAENDNYLLLQKNVSKLNAKCINAGIWHRNCPLNVTTTELSSGTVGYVVEENEDGILQGISISELMRLEKIEKIDILKMDIEGAEFSIFDSGEYRKWINKVNLLIIEIHDCYRKGATDEICQLIKQEGFSLYKISEDWYFVRNM